MRYRKQRDAELAQLAQLAEIIKNADEPFTVDQVRQVIRLLFKDRLNYINHTCNSLHLKSAMEIVSFRAIGKHKYCASDTLREAFRLENFKVHNLGHKDHYNISYNDVKSIHRRFYY